MVNTFYYAIANAGIYLLLNLRTETINLGYASKFMGMAPTAVNIKDE